MANFAIFRVAKLKSKREIKGALMHNFRELDTPNSDPDGRVDQKFDRAEVDERYNDLMSDVEKIRKNAVHGVEFVVTFSPEVKTGKLIKSSDENYFLDARKFIESKIGGEKNIISASMHFDEKTPHLHIIAIPKDHEKKCLNFNKYLGGGPAVFQALQDDFYEKVGKKYDLDRGLRNSKAKHKSIRQFYGELEEKKNELLRDGLEKRKEIEERELQKRKEIEERATRKIQEAKKIEVNESTALRIKKLSLLVNEPEIKEAIKIIERRNMPARENKRKKIYRG